MTQGEKTKFRMSGKWKKFRSKMKKLANSFDWVTKKPLSKTWNLHHLDMRDKNYTDCSSIDRFMPLNKDTHEFVHWLYHFWCHDKNIITRLEFLMIKMYSATHDNKGVNHGVKDENSST